jgi:serine/threonine-protein kinase SRPK3
MTDDWKVDNLARDYLTMISIVANAAEAREDVGDALEREAEEARKRAERLALLDAEYESVKVKIVDLGNACWTYKHFTDDIQTRQYRAPEVLLGASYDTSADMWSMACIVFELITGDLLFDPHAGKTWDREEDHLAMMIELLGNFPRSVSSKGKFAGQYFNKRGELRHIHQLKFWGLKDVLHDKYKLCEEDAQEIADFMTPMLEVRK